MTDVIWAALITTGGLLLIALGGGVWRIITLILQTYKEQAEATVDAKDAELGTLKRDNQRLEGEVISRLSALQSEVGETRQDIWTLRRSEPR